MQTDRSVDPVNRLDNAQQEEKVPFAPPPSSYRTPDASGTAGSSVWIDPVVQRNISATSFTYEKSRRALPPASVSPTPASSTPPAIPRRASAHPTSAIKVRPRYTRRVFIPEESDITRIPTLPQPTMWQYETPEYQAESSLSSLSLVVADVPTTPPTHQTERGIDKIDTIPGNIQRGGVAPLNTPLPLGELDTAPPGAVTVASSIAPTARTASGIERSPTIVEEGTLASWTTGRGAHSPLARRIVGRQRTPLNHSTSSLWTSVFSPLDRLRWWLLTPGRLEFLLWFSGTLLLMSITCIFLFICLVSAGWLGGSESSAFLATQQTVTTPCTPTVTGSEPCVASTHTSSGLSTPMLTASFTGPLEAGMSLRLQGRGFSANGRVTLIHDAVFPCEPNAVSADEHGTFVVEVVLGVDASWGPGPHVLTAYDTVSKRSAMTTITLAPNPIGRSATPTAVPASTATPSNNGGYGPLPTPVGLGQTPTPTIPTPTAGITPTPTQPVPTATLTPGITPTPTPSPAPATPTPTASAKSTASATTGSRDISSTSQAVALDAMTASTNSPQSSSIWLWLMGVGYGLSLALLGVAGVVYRRRRAH